MQPLQKEVKVVDFKVQKKVRKNIPYVAKEDLDISREFAKRVYKEFGTFISGLMLFGSSTQGQKKPKSDIDILIIIDDVHVYLSKEILETYKIIVERAILNISTKIHVQSMKLTSFWEYTRAGDPVAINMLRTGIALIDTGFLEPLQHLLEEGRIRPSKESVFTYFQLSYDSLSKANTSSLNSIIELYWAAINASHSALMSLNIIPPSPQFVPNYLNEHLIKNKLLDKKYVSVMEDIYILAKRIMHREVKEISGKEYDKHHKDVTDFVAVMRKIIEKRN